MRKDKERDRCFERKNLYGALLLEMFGLCFLFKHIITNNVLDFVFMLFFWITGILVLYAGRLPKDDEIVKEQNQ